MKFKESKDHTMGGYLQSQVAFQKSLNIEKRPVTKDQAESTKRLLSMNDEELEVYRNRPMPENWKAEKDAEKVFSKSKANTPDNIAREQGRRKESKNTQGDAWSEGTTVFSPEQKQRAIEGFLYTPPAEPTEEQLKKILVEIEKIEQRNLVKEVPDPKPSFLSRIRTALRLGAKANNGHVDWRTARLLEEKGKK